MPKYKDSEASPLILDRIESTRTFKKPYEDLFNELYELYRFYQNPTQEVKKGNIPNYVVPYIYSQIETKLPRIIQSIWAFRPFFKVLGVGEEDKPQAEENQETLHHQIYNEMNFLKFLMNWWKPTLMYGTSFALCLWEQEKKKVKERFTLTDEEAILGIEPIRDAERVVYDGHNIQALDIFDCYPAPFGTTIQGRKSERIPYFILRQEVDADFLRGMMNQKDKATGKPRFNNDAIKTVLTMEGGVGNINRTRRERLKVLGRTENVFLDRHTSRYEMYTMFEDDSVVSDIGGHLIQNNDNPFFEQEIPILMAQDTPVPNELFAIGHAEPLIKTNYYMDDLMNLELENLQRVINPGLIASVDSRVNINALKENLSGIHPARGNAGAAVAPIQMGSGAIVGKSQRQELERLGDRAVGSDSFIGGQPQTRGDATLGEIERRLQQSNIRFNLSVLYLMESSLKPLISKMIKRNHQFLPQEKRVRVYGPKGSEIKFLKRDDLMGTFDVEIKIAPLQGNKQAWASTLINFLGIVGKTRGAFPGLTRRIAEALELEDVEELIKDPGRDALILILEAQRRGLLNDPAQTGKVLNAVIETLAPAGSENADFANTAARKRGMDTSGRRGGEGARPA